MSKAINVLFFLFSLFINILSEDEKILFAFQMNRHGARAPYYGVENDKDVFHEPWLKPKELSSIGKRQLYLLGTKARKRYIEKYKLLKEQYNPQEIYIKSTESNRTIESTYSFIQGLYPNGTGQTISDKIINNTNITYPPNINSKNDFEYIINKYNLNENYSALPYNMGIMPIHIFYEPDHDFKLYDSDICKGLIEKYEKQNNRKEIRDLVDELMKEKKDFFMNLEKDINNKTIDEIDENFLYDYWNLYRYTDSMVCDDIDRRSFYNLKEKYPDQSDYIEEFKKISRKFLIDDYVINNNSTNMSVVDNSYTMHSVLNWMQKAIDNYNKKTNDQYIKYVVYSTHDSSIGTLEGFMYYAFNTTIEFADLADSRFIELYVDSNNKLNVRYLRGDSSVKFDVTFEEFKKVINEKTWSDQKVAEFCQFEEKKNGGQSSKKSLKYVYIGIMIGLGTLNLILLISLILCSIKK